MTDKRTVLTEQEEATNHVAIGRAAQQLGVSIDTIRRWERAGKIQAHRLGGKNRYFAVADLKRLQQSRPLTTAEVAAELGMSASTVRRLEREGKLIPSRDSNGKRQYDKQSIQAYKTSTNTPQLGNLQSIQLQDKERAIAPLETKVAQESAAEVSVLQIHARRAYTYMKGDASKPLTHFHLMGGMAVLLILLIIAPWNSASDTTSAPKLQAVASANTGSDASVTPLVLPSTFFVSLPNTGLVVNMSSESLKGSAAASDMFAHKPVVAADITDHTLTAQQVAEGGISLINLSSEVQALIAAARPNPNSETTNMYTTNLYQTVGTTVLAGLGLRGTTDTAGLTLDLQTGMTTTLAGNNLEVQLSGGIATTAGSSGSGLEATASGLQLLGGCGTGQVLQWAGSAWVCSTVAGGSSNLAIQEGGGTVTANAAQLNFNNNDFTVVNSGGGQAMIAIDYANSGLTRTSSNQAITGNWSFMSSGFSISDVSDSTKRVNFGLGGISSGATRTIHLPDASGTLITTGNLNSITTLGTIGSGVWQGSTLGVQYGGTGTTSFAAGGVLYGNGSGALQASAAGSPGQVLAANASGQPQFMTLGGDAGLSALGNLTLANVNSSVGTYGDGMHVPTLTIDAKGRITAVSNTVITGAAPTGAASGDLTGTFPTPTLAKLQGNTLTIGSLSGGQLLLYNGSAFVNQSLTGDIVLDSAGATTIGAGRVTNSKLEHDSLTVTAGAGLSGGSTVALGGTTSLSVQYGSSNSTAAQGNTALSFTGSGNLTGSLAGTAGGGFTTTTLALINNPTFTTSITTPSLTNSNNLAISATGAGHNLSLSAAGSIILNGFNCSSFDNGGVLTTNASGALQCANDDGGTASTITGSGTLNRIPLYTGSGSLGDSTLAQNGTVLQLDSGNDLSLLGGNLGVTGNITGLASINAATLQTGATDRIDTSGVLKNVSADNADGVSFDANTITGGTLTDNRLSTNVTVQGNTFNGASQLVKLDSGGKLPMLDGSALTNLAAGSFTGTLAVGHGGTGQTSFTANGLLYGNGSGGLLATAAGTNGQVLLSNAGTPTFTSLTGDIAINGTGSTTIGSGAVTGAKIAANTITNSNLQSGSYGNITGVGTLGSLTVTGNSTIAGTLASLTGLTSSGTITFSGLSSAGIVHNSAAGTLSTGAVTNAELANSSLTIIAGTGLSGGGSVSLGGSSTGLNVNYGATSTSAVRGDITLVCASGSGNLSGGGNIITLGAGGTCSGLTMVNNPSFSTSVTTPSLLSSGALSISSTGSNDVTLTSGSGTVVFGASTLKNTGNLTHDLNGAGTNILTLTNSGTGVADLNISEGGLQIGSTAVLSSGRALQNLTGITSSGIITFSGLNSTGIVHTSASGQLSTSALALGADTTGSYVANLGTLTGLTTSGNSGVGSTPTLSVTYGSGTSTAVQGNTSLTCPSGSGNLSGGGTVITLGSGGTCAGLSIINNPSFSGLITGSSSTTGLALTGAPTNSAMSSLIQIGNAISGGNTVANGGTYIGLNAPNTGAGSAADFLNFQLNGTSKFKIDTNGNLTSGTINGATLSGGTLSGGTFSGGTHTATAVNGLNVSAGTITSATFTGTLTGSSSPTITGFGTINGATLSGGIFSGGNVSSGTLTGTAVNSLNVSGTAISGSGTGLAVSAGGTAQNLTLDGATTGKVQIGATSTGDVELAGGNGGGNGCTITNSNGNLTCTGTINGATISGGLISGGTLSATGVNGLTISAGTLSGVTGLTFTSGSLNLASGGITNAGSVAGVTTLSANDTITTTKTGGQALTVSGAPAAGATNTLIQVGQAITGGSAAGTYLSVNQGAGGTADFLNLSVNGAQKLKVDSTGLLTATGINAGSAALSSVSNLSLTGTISGGTTYNGSGNINTTAGTLQTNSTNRLDNSGNLVNIGNFTGAAGVTFATTGAAGFTFKPGTDNGNAFLIQNAAGTTTLLDVDTSTSTLIIAGTITTFATFTLTNSHFKSTQTTTPTISTPAACGTTPSSAVTAGSTDSAGSFYLNHGTGTTTSTCTAIITFNKAYGAAPKSVILTPNNTLGGTAPTTALVATVTAENTTTFTVRLVGATTASNRYGYSYWVIE